MQRSETTTALTSELKQRMGLAANNPHRQFESYINKPLKATSGTVNMEKVTAN